MPLMAKAQQLHKTMLLQASTWCSEKSSRLSGGSTRNRLSCSESARLDTGDATLPGLGTAMYGPVLAF